VVGWLRPDLQFAFQRQVRQTHRTHRTQGIIFADERKSDNECTGCGMKNYAWKYCRKPVQVSGIYRGQSKPKRQSAFTAKGRPQVATVAVDGQGESSRRGVQRPPGGAFEEDDIS